MGVRASVESRSKYNLAQAAEEGTLHRLSKKQLRAMWSLFASDASSRNAISVSDLEDELGTHNTRALSAGNDACASQCRRGGASFRASLVRLDGRPGALPRAEP